MKRVTLLLLCCLFVHFVSAQRGGKRVFIGFQTGVNAPLNDKHFGISQYKIGLPSFSYAASIENRFTLNYTIQFSLQYSISYFNLMRKDLQKNITEIEAKNAEESKRAKEFSSGISLNTLYRVKNDLQIVGGIGVAKPFSFTDKNVCRKNSVQADCRPSNNNKFIPVLNPFFMIGIENSCKIFNKNLTYTIQYNIGFAPYRTSPVQSLSRENQYMHGVNIGLKYKY